MTLVQQHWSKETKAAFGDLVDSLKAMASDRYVPMISARGIPAIGVLTSRGEFALTNNAVRHIWEDHPWDEERQRLTVADVIDALENPLNNPDDTFGYNKDGKPQETFIGRHNVSVGLT